MSKLKFSRNALTTFLSVMSFAGAAFAQQEQPPQTQQVSFEQCIVQLSQRAAQAGVSEKIINMGLADAQFIAKVIEYDRNQPEFVQSFASYLNKRVTQWRIDKGREMLDKHATLLSNLSAQYGVPAHYLVAFWGLETNFGAYKGKMPTLDSLATLACDPRRSAFFSKELIVALQLMEREQFEKSSMIGSWAGAMGHTQFMPSAYMRYALDGDDDGKVDLWESEADALSSAANFLQSLGWQAGSRWGREVILGKDFDYSQSGRENAKPLSHWHDLGVTDISGEPLPALAMQGAVLVPSGHEGPAFMVYHNFSVIMGWNNSESYALAVGYLADRLVGGSALSAPLIDGGQYAIADMKTLQNRLNLLGFDVGEADGVFGPATRNGIRSFQTDAGLIADGFPDPQLFDAVAKAVQAE